MDGCSSPSWTGSILGPRPSEARTTAILRFKTKEELAATHPNSEVLSDYPNFPDFENARDADGDNVYEITIVVTDSTLVNRDELDVTVKVINSTEDNRPGKVLISNRQPEGGRVLTATLVDADLPIKDLNWQWYRSTDADLTDECGTVSAAATPPNVFTLNPDLFEDTDDDGVFAPDIAWEKIVGAKSATYTPEWDAGADVDRPQDDAGKCLMAGAMYTDWDAADPTMPDNPDTADKDESREPEKAYGISEHPVVVEDQDNPDPLFRVDPNDPFSAAADSYTVTVPENRPEGGGPFNIGILTDAESGGVNDEGFGILDGVVAAIDDEPLDVCPNGVETCMPGVPDPNRNEATDDILTYTLSGPDAKFFQITGSIAMPVADENDAGQLMTRDSLNFEEDNEYRLTLTATDPSGDSDTIIVIVNVTDENDPLKLSGPKGMHYKEDSTDAIATYKATDEDKNGITYSLVPIVGSNQIVVSDHEVFTIDSLDGTLTFRPPSDGKARPNYELPEDELIEGQ